MSNSQDDDSMMMGLPQKSIASAVLKGVHDMLEIPARYQLRIP
jgi:hypothetical protein